MPWLSLTFNLSISLAYLIASSCSPISHKHSIRPASERIYGRVGTYPQKCPLLSLKHSLPSVLLPPSIPFRYSSFASSGVFASSSANRLYASAQSGDIERAFFAIFIRSLLLAVSHASYIIS